MSIDIYKRLLEDFFERYKSETISKTINREQVNFNSYLFQIEKHLVELKLRYNVNQVFNAEITSDNILKSFTFSSPTALNGNAYSLSFLVFLSLQENHDAENLLKLMADYIEIIKDKLTYQDIVKTSTGVTRCYTNIRFALNDLRNFGLVFSNNGKSRTLLPTPFGYLISLSILNSRDNLKSLLCSRLSGFWQSLNQLN